MNPEDKAEGEQLRLDCEASFEKIVEAGNKILDEMDARHWPGMRTILKALTDERGIHTHIITGKQAREFAALGVTYLAMQWLNERHANMVAT